MRKWKRSSSFGYHMGCTYRAALERQEAEGNAEREVIEAVEANAFRTNAYAAHGTVSHWVLQKGMGCAFPKLDENGDVLRGVPLSPDYAQEHKYTDEELDIASGLFGNDTTKELKVAHAVASRAARRIQKEFPLDEGVYWMAELEVDGICPGHIDFTSSDLKYIIDLKTATRPPGGIAKLEHIRQVHTYAANTGAKRLAILYVDSQKADWDHWVDWDLNDEELLNYFEDTLAANDLLDSEDLFKYATRSFSDANCTWCPFKKICRDRIEGKFRVRHAGTSGSCTQPTSDFRAKLGI